MIGAVVLDELVEVRLGCVVDDVVSAVVTGATLDGAVVEVSCDVEVKEALSEGLEEVLWGVTEV